MSANRGFFCSFFSLSNRGTACVYCFVRMQSQTPCIVPSIPGIFVGGVFFFLIIHPLIPNLFASAICICPHAGRKPHRSKMRNVTGERQERQMKRRIMREPITFL